MEVIYVAGKYRGESWNEVWENIMHARREARKLWLSGFAVICPHTNSIFMDGIETDGIFLNGDLEILSRCDAIYMLLGWECSLGAKQEYAVARKLGKKIYFED